MSDFKIHHHINELMTLLMQSQEDLSGADMYADLLLKNMTPHLTNQVGAFVAVKKLAEKYASDDDEFRRKYEELKSKNVRDVDALVCLLAKIADDDKTRTFLARNAQSRIDEQQLSSKAQRTGELSSEELALLRSRLLKEAQSTSSTVRSTRFPSSRFHASSDRFASSYPDRACPEFPSWVRDRPNLTLDFNVLVTDSRIAGSTLGAVPLPSQEVALLDDLLYCLAGVPGEHVVAQPLDDLHSIRHFAIDETIDGSLKELVRRILPLCSDYSTVARFVEEKSDFEFGSVNHSLCAAMRSIIKDYFVLIAQFEHQHRQGSLTLQRLWFYIQPTMRTMETLASLAAAINACSAKGGAVLGLLHEKASSITGDVKTHEIRLYLTQAACVPYFEILEKWIYKGVIWDPFGEFLVEDNELVQKEELPDDYSNDYWEKRYTIRHERIPSFLEGAADTILRTGKYLNVIRQCGEDIRCPDAEPIAYTPKERKYVERIERAYRFASRVLLDLLLDRSDLMGRLRSVKHYFLLDQGDFVVQFLDMADDELRKRIGDILPQRLDSLLELAIRTSVATVDPYNDDVRVALLPYDLLSQMFKILSIETEDESVYRFPVESQLSGLEAFAFDYDVKWPLSLILNRKALACYQMLFRHLLYSKHVERLLCNVWVSNQLAKSFPLSAARCYAPAFALRQRMLTFVQNLEYYMTFEVLEPNWHVFVTKLQAVSNVDDVLHCHTDFLNVCLKDCMLTSPELLRIVNRLMTNFVTFSNFILQVNKYFVEAEIGGGAVVDDTSEAAAAEVTSSQESFEQRIARFDAEFTKYLVLLLDRISDMGRGNYNEKLLNILYRVDVNGFYTEQLEKYVLERSMTELSGKAAQKTKKRPPVPPKSPKLSRFSLPSSESS